MNPTTRRRFLQWLGGAGALGLLGGARRGFAGTLQRVERTSRALGTHVSITALHDDPEAAGAAIDAAFTELERVEAVLSLYRPESQLCRLNRDGSCADPHAYLTTVLAAARAMSERSGGAFDVTVQPLWELYAAAARQGAIPDSAAVATARARVDWRKVEISAHEIRLAGTGTAVTLNGIAQGFALDRVMETLRRRGIEHALLDTGELGALGSKEAGAPWTAGIQHPRVADAYVALAAFDGRCLATSGDYQTTFTPDRAYNHIFDPATGRSPETLASVTIAATTGMEADALSTAVFVLGPDRGADLLRATPGADAFMVLKDGRALKTPGFPQTS